MNELQKAARAYTRENGCRPPLPIFPLAPKSKLPFPGSHGFYDATTDEKTVVKLWERSPQANIGLYTKGLVVLDIDRHSEDADGFDSLHQLEREHEPLPETWTVLTPTGGEHYYYLSDDPRLSVGTNIKPGIDFRGNLGYVAIPPSIHPNGGVYEWEAGHLPNETPLAPLPEWMHEILLEAVAKNRGEKGKRDEIPPNIPEGARNDTLFRLACLFRAQGLVESEMYDAINSINKGRCNPPLPESEIRAICASAARYERGEISAQEVDASTKTNSIRDIVNLLKSLKPHETYSWDDMGAGKLFSDVFQHTTRYNSTIKEWMTYDGKRWKQDAGGMKAAQCAKMLSDALMVFCTTLPDGKTRAAYAKYVSQFGRLSARETMVKDARSERFITNADLDQRDDLYNCQNGEFDLNTLQLLPHDPAHLLSKISNVWYDPAAKSDEWEKVVAEMMLGDAEKIRYNQKLWGITLTADTGIERMFILYGPTTRNGKSTETETISYMHGGQNGYAFTIQPETLAQRKNRDSRQASGDIARLDGCRLVVASEPPKRMLFDAALVKTLLGRDTITARNLYEREFQFVPKFTLVMNTNYLPYIKDDTLFTSRRVDVLTFDRHFKPEEQDTRLKSRLKTRENISGIFNWCVSGLRAFREDGIEPPAAVVAATDDYQKNSDKIGLFIDECMIPSDDNSKGGEVYNAFAEWARANGFEGGSKQTFWEDMRSRGLFAKAGQVTVNKKKQSFYNVIVGYKLNTETTTQPDTRKSRFYPLDDDGELPFE